jgi:hypothetical protein
MSEATNELIAAATREQTEMGGLNVPNADGSIARSSHRCPRCGAVIRVEYEGGFPDRYDHGGLEYWRWSIERTSYGAVALARSHSESRTYGGRSSGTCGLRIRQLNGSPRSAIEQIYDSAFGRDVPHVRVERFDLDALRQTPWTALAQGDQGAPPIRMIADDHALRFSLKHGRMPETIAEYESIDAWGDAALTRELADLFLKAIGAVVVEIP